MVNVKKRRSLGIFQNITDALEDYAKEHKIESHTSIASKIWKGEMPALHVDIECEGKRRDISMTEDLWMAIRVYAEEKKLPSSNLASLILIGKYPPIPDHCIRKGNKLTKEREYSRLSLSSTDIAEVLDPDPALSCPTGIDESHDEALVDELMAEKRAEEARIQISKTKVDPSQNIQSVSQEADKNKHLSKGVPFENKEIKERKIDPDDDFYSGVFTF